MEILFLSAWFPYPPTNGAKVRVYNLLKGLSKEHKLSLVSLANTKSKDEASAQIPYLKPYCETIDIFESKSVRLNQIRSLLGYFSLYPRSISHTYDKELENKITSMLDSRHFDIVIASEVSAPSIISFYATRIPRIPKVLDAIEVGLLKDRFLGEKKLAGRVRRGLTWYKQRGYTRKVLSASKLCTVPSKDEQQHLLEIAPGSEVVVVPNGLDVEHYKGSFGSPQKNRMIFTGSFSYFPNLDAAKFFLEDIYPRIKRSAPQAEFEVLGSTNGVDPSTLAVDDDIIFTGFHMDVRPMVSSAVVSVVPLRHGGGTRIKILESMALRTPVVSTSKGAEGLDVVHGEHLLVADTPEEFADAVLRLLNDRALRNRLAENAFALLKEKYNWDVILPRFLDLVETVVSSR